MSLRSQMRYLNPYEIHKVIVNDYILKKPGDTRSLKRDCSKDRTDYHVIKDNHKFLWTDNDKPESWEEEFAKKYYEKLFKEYCIADLSFYKANKIALRWRVEQEVVVGKGQFICGNKHCSEKENLRTWEVNFAYKENDEKKNALIKLRLCPSCSTKLNYHSKKREIKRIKHKLKHKKDELLKSTLNKKKSANDEEKSTVELGVLPSASTSTENTRMDLKDDDTWAQQKVIEVKSREDEMQEYLDDLLL